MRIPDITSSLKCLAFLYTLTYITDINMKINEIDEIEQLFHKPDGLLV